MAPKRGTNVKPRSDQERWEWVKTLEKLHTQDEILQEHIHKSYAIDAPKCERGTCRINCKKNPNCHNQLGEKFWSSEIKDSYWIDVDDPEEQRKDKGSHVGLKNLGATCYVNTFLQLWFHNPDFCSAIFKWVPSEGYSCFAVDIQENMQISEKSAAENEDSPSKPVLKDLPSPTFGTSPADNICGNLQLLFALMKYSEKRFVDPTPFVQSLGLQTDEQQDAQEFSKLFMSLLESSLSNQRDSVKDLVQNQYGGQYAYETRCTVCKKVSNRESNFYELDLSIQGHRLLRECIKEFLKEEKLDGDNKYFCANCQMKQDATRRIVLQALPRVLNLQLLRFVFDRDTGYKRKCNTSVRFPEVLDMNDFMRKGDPSVGIYELTAVLIHCGVSAYSGHYVAHILDKEDEVWYRFNDETVEKMKGKKLVLGAEEDPEDGGKNSNKVKSGKGQHCSKNAYMLVYTRKGGGVENSSEVEPPDFIQNYVANSNMLFENWVSKIRSLMDSKIREGRLRCEEVLQIYSNMYPESVDESEWITTEWLKQWLADKQKMIPPIDNSPLMCKHGRFDVCKVHLSKRVSIKVADILFKKYGGLPRLKYDSLCPCCVYNQAKRVQFDEKLNRDKHKINNAVKSNYTGSNGFWVGKSSLRQWKQLAIAAQDFDCVDGPFDSEFVPEHDESLNLQGSNEVKNGNESISSKLDNVEAEFYEGKEERSLFSGTKEEGFNSDVQCQNHGNLCIEEKKRCIVSNEVWSCLKYYFKDCPEFRADDQPCLLCQEQSSKKQVQRGVFRSLASRMRTVLHDLYQNHVRPELHREVAFEVYVVCRQTIEDWRRFLRSVLSHPYELIENSDLFCEHGKLLYNSDDFFNAGPNEDYVLVTKEEWNTLSSFIPFDREIKLSNCWTNPDNMLNFSMSCECCDDCRMIRVIGEQASTTQYFNAPLYIRKIKDDRNSLFNEESELPGDGRNEGFDQKLEKKQNSNKRKLSEQAEGQRKSARHRMQRGEYMIKVNSSQTLKEVKIQLLPIFSVIPCDQHLSFVDGTPLADDSLMLSELGVLPGSILLLRVDEPNEAAPISEVVTSNGQRKLEEGFKGTGLCGVFQPDQSSAS